MYDCLTITSFLHEFPWCLELSICPRLVNFIFHMSQYKKISNTHNFLINIRTFLPHLMWRATKAFQNTEVEFDGMWLVTVTLKEKTISFNQVYLLQVFFSVILSIQSLQTHVRLLHESLTHPVCATIKHSPFSIFSFDLITHVEICENDFRRKIRVNQRQREMCALHVVWVIIPYTSNLQTNEAGQACGRWVRHQSH